MREAINVLYRLFAPLFVVVLIIGGVGLTSELVKNSNQKQTALSVAYAGGCPASAMPIKGACVRRDRHGRIIPDPCVVPTKKAGIVIGHCLDYGGVGCCHGDKWLNAKAAQKMQIKTPEGGSMLNIKGAVDLMKNIMDMMNGGGGGSEQTGPQDFTKPPKCTNIVQSTTLPLRPGESSTIAWTVSGGSAENTVVTPAIGIVHGLSVRVSPKISTTYTVILQNKAGKTACPKIRVHVGPIADDSQDTISSNRSNINNGYTDAVGDVVDEANSSTSGAGSKYDDLSSNNTGDQEEDITDVTKYNYVYDEDIDNKLPIDDKINYRSNIDSKNSVTKDDNFKYEELGYTDSKSEQSVDIDDLYTYEDLNNTQYNTLNSNGLTDQEIYGVWSRPKSPVTGSLGLSADYTNSDKNSNQSDDGNKSVFSRVGTWVKNTFCFWCNTSASTSISNLAIARLATFNPSPLKCGGVLSIVSDPQEVIRDKCDITMTDIECRELWVGRKIQLKWNIPCDNLCRLEGPDQVILNEKIVTNGTLDGILLDTGSFKITCINKLGKISGAATEVNIR